MKTKVLVTGFGPFEDVDPNPSALVAGQLNSLGYAEKAIILPTSFARSVAEVERIITELCPQILLMTGFSTKANGLKIETKARNIQSNRPDIDGKIPKACDELKSNLTTQVDISKLSKFLDEQGITYAISSDAGEYVCEYAYHAALAKIEQLSLNTKCLFVHLNNTSYAESLGLLADWLRNTYH